MSIEQFLGGAGERALSLPDGERDKMVARIELARTFIGSQDPLDFLRGWKTPEERYSPRYPAGEDG